jgi:hypothetical protein
MKRIILFLMLLSAFNAFAQQSGTLYVAAKTGLSMRERPDAEANVLEKIPYGTKISIIPVDEELKSIMTEGIEGYWQKVKYNNKTGYILDSYLFPWPPPKLATVKEMKNYFAQVAVPFGGKLVVKSGTMNNIEDGGWQVDKQLYKNGAEWHQFHGYEYGSNTYFLPNFSLQQGFLLLRMIPEFKEVFGEKEEFPTKTTTIKKGEVEYLIRVDKWLEDSPFIQRIHIEFSPDASYIFDMYMMDNQLVIFYGSGV